MRMHVSTDYRYITTCRCYPASLCLLAPMLASRDWRYRTVLLGSAITEYGTVSLRWPYMITMSEMVFYVYRSGLHYCSRPKRRRIMSHHDADMTSNTNVQNSKTTAICL